MYIKLTRLDNSPIWINAAFVVTVEPRKGGGSIVVPIGDGLDYDVRETPEKVLAMLDGAPAAEVVPVPVPKSLTPMPADVSPEPESRPEPPSEPQPAAELSAEPPAKRTTRTRKARTAATAEHPAVRKTRAKAAKKAELALTDEQVEKLRKMAPGSLRKLTNTLATQFNVQDAEQAVAALKDRNVISVEHEHVTWVAPQA